MWYQSEMKQLGKAVRIDKTSQLTELHGFTAWHSLNVLQTGNVQGGSGVNQYSGNGFYCNSNRCERVFPFSS